MALTCSTLHGLTVAAPVALAGGGSDDVVAPDVRLEVSTGGLPTAAGTVLADCRVPGPGYVLTRDRARWALTFPDVAVARWVGGSAPVVVDVRVAPSVPPALLPVLLGGPVISAVALSRGHTLLHASAVSWAAGAGAVALIGPAGSGKSSVARLLVGDGRTLLSDDALRVDDRGAAGVVVHRGTTVSRLRTGLAVGDGVRTRRAGDGRILVDDDAVAPVSERLVAVLRPLLSRSLVRPRVRELEPLEVVAQLGSSWPLGGVEDPELLTARLGWAAALLGRVPVMALEVPWTGPTSPAERAALVGTVGALVDAGPRGRAGSR